MKKDGDRYFYTSNFPVAVFLCAKNQQVVNVYPLGREQKEFVFVRSSRLEELEYKYKFGDKHDEDLLIQVHLYEQARRELLNLLKDTKLNSGIISY